MKYPPHSTLHALFAAQSSKIAKPALGNWIAAFLEALYEMQRHQALGVIRTYEHFLGLPDDGTGPVNAAAKDRDDAGR
jgi:hypothetical protein